MSEEKDKEFTQSLGEMISGGDLSTIQLANDIIKAQPDLVDSNALKNHWYNINDYITADTMAYVELYCKSGKSDKVYLIIINYIRSNKTYSLDVFYGRRGKTLRAEIGYQKSSFLSYVEQVLFKLKSAKMAKGYKLISEWSKH